MHLDRRLLALARRAGGWLFLSIVCGTLGGLVAVAQATWLSRVLAGVLIVGGGAGRLAELAGPLAGLLGAAVARAGLAWGQRAAGSLGAAQVRARLRQRLGQALLLRPPAALSIERRGEVATTVIDGVEACDAYLGRYLPQVALAVLVPLTIAAAVLRIDLLSGLVLLLTAPLIPLFLALIGRVAAERGRAEWQALSRLGAVFVDLVQGLPELVRLGRARERVAATRAMGEDLRQRTMAVLKVALLSGLTLEGIVTLSTAVVAVEVGLRLLYGHISFEQAILVLLLTPEYYQPLRLLGSHFHDGLAATSAAERIFELLDQEPAPDSTTSPAVPTPLPPALIELRGVAFSYREAGRSSRREALEDVSFILEPGSMVALVGPSGAGKSTVAALVLGLLRPDRGELLLGGRPLEQVDVAAWQRGIAWVPQHPHLFRASVHESIALSRPSASRAEVEAAAQQAGAHAMILELPQGYDTIVGEGATGLSGGQVQRLALARAFLRRASLLILDEPVARLDPRLEAHLLEATRLLLTSRSSGTSALVIAHRAATARMADRVIVLDAGNVVEQGRHAELAAAGGLYARLLAAGDGGFGDGGS